jgi:hypothetical protein
LIKSGFNERKVDLTNDIAQERVEKTVINKTFSTNKINQMRDKRALSHQNVYADILCKQEDIYSEKSISDGTPSTNYNGLEMSKIKSAFDVYPDISFCIELQGGITDNNVTKPFKLANDILEDNINTDGKITLIYIPGTKGQVKPEDPNKFVVKYNTNPHS